MVEHLIEAHRVKIRIAVGLQVVVRANPGIGLDGGPAAGFVGSGTIAVAARAIAAVTVEGVIAAKLMPQLMGHKVNVKRIADGTAKPRFSARLLPVDSYHPPTRPVLRHR